MLQSLTEKAISAALKQNWSEAIALNLQVLEIDPNHIPTLNRLARCYKELGKISKAVKIYEQVLALDKYNTIAQKNIGTLKTQKNYAANGVTCQYMMNFVEEPGKTKTITLQRLGDSAALAQLQPGLVVTLIPKKHCIAVHSPSEAYIGSLADDVSFKLKSFMEKGSQYEVAVKSCSEGQITIFIRETVRGDATPSFA